MVTTRSKTSRLTSEGVKDSILHSEIVSSTPSNQRIRKLKSSPARKYDQLIIFASLLLDLVAFTIILPLFPSILQYYEKYDEPNGLYSYLEGKIEYFQNLTGTPSKYNNVLFGGFLGSLFSFLQFLAGPIVGAFSDVYGRKILILLCLVGIGISYWIWSISNSFLTFVIARIIGGISKGNLSLSMAAMADVSSSEKRASGMALIGAAFSVGFVIGPLIGAFFVKPFSAESGGTMFTTPAWFALYLTISEIVFVAVFFKETLPTERRLKSVANSLRQAVAYINVKDLFLFTPVKNVTVQDIRQLRRLGFIFFLYMFIFSGLEFTLTFLTQNKFQYTYMEHGYMLAAIGVVMAILQGTFIRKVPSKLVQNYTSAGLFLIIPAFLAVGLGQTSYPLIFGLFLFAVSTSLVVPCMTTIASKYGTPSQKGTALGIFRALGALARAVGPIVASIAYWMFGPVITYCVGGLLLVVPFFMMASSPPMKM